MEFHQVFSEVPQFEELKTSPKNLFLEKKYRSAGPAEKCHVLLYGLGTQRET